MRELLITPGKLLSDVIWPALDLLPRAMRTHDAARMLLAIALQESALISRWQIVDPKDWSKKGPARGLWQFELGSQASRGGVWGVSLHPSSRYWLSELCKERDVDFTPPAIYAAIERDDILAAGVARLLMFTSPQRLPNRDGTGEGWMLYKSTWRPGKPHAEKWSLNWATACGCLPG